MIKTPAEMAAVLRTLNPLDWPEALESWGASVHMLSKSPAEVRKAALEEAAKLADSRAHSLAILRSMSAKRAADDLREFAGCIRAIAATPQSAAKVDRSTVAGWRWDGRVYHAETHLGPAVCGARVPDNSSFFVALGPDMLPCAWCLRALDAPGAATAARPTAQGGAGPHAPAEIARATEWQDALADEDLDD